MAGTACCGFPISSSTWATLRAILRTVRRNPGAERRTRRGKDNYAHVGTLSNLKEDGKYIGSPDAGQDWHTDMSYRDVMGFVNVLYGIRIPRRNGVPLGGTEFSNMHMAYEALPADIKTRLADATATHNFEKFWEHMRRDKASDAPADDRGTAPPPSAGGASAVPHASDHRPEGAVLQSRLHHADQRTRRSARATRCWNTCSHFQLEPRFRHTHTWTENDLLVWDHLGTIHRAIADYGPDEIRLMRRCQVMATKVFDPEFLRPVRELATRRLHSCAGSDSTTEGRTAYGSLNGDTVSEISGEPWGAHAATGKTHKLADVKLEVPVIPRTFYAAGINYAAHIREMAEKRGVQPVFPGEGRHRLPRQQRADRAMARTW